MHTDMQCRDLEENYVHKCQVLWWTVYVLERYMSVFTGVPNFICDEDICTPLPAFPNQAQKTGGLHIQVKLSQVLGQIERSQLSRSSPSVLSCLEY